MRFLHYLSTVDMGDEIIEYFDEPVVLHHPGGHFIPNSPEQRPVYSEFLSKQLQHKSDNNNQTPT